MITIYIPSLPLRSYEYRRGDAQLLHDEKGNCIVIDGGEPDLCNKLIAYCRSKGINHITYILTHWHVDHDKGLKQFLDVSGICVDKIYCPPPSELKGLQESGVGDDYARALSRIAYAERLSKPIVYPKAGVVYPIQVGEIKCNIWRRAATRADKDDYEVNNTSMVTYFPELYYLTSGDTINSFDIYLSGHKDTVKVFKVPHHGNACTTNPCEKLKAYGAELCWYNDFEPKGTAIGGTGFSKWGAGYTKKYFTTLRTDADIYMTCYNKQMVVTKGSQRWVFPIPYCSAGRWVEMDRGWKYINSDGVELTDGAYEIEGKWYYFDAEGYRREGWIEDGGDGIPRYCNPFMYINAFVDKHYVDGYGRMVTGWYQVEGKWYCFDEKGVMRLGWYNDPDLGLRYLDPHDGYMYVNTTARIGGKDYYFDGYGRVTEGVYIIPNEGFKGYNVTKRTAKIQYIVVHYVGAEGTAAENVVYYNSPRKASADYFVGHAGEVCEYNPDIEKYYSWHCGGGKESSKGGTYYGKCTNGNSIGVELCVKKTSSGWRFSEQTLASAAALVKMLMQRYAIPADRVIRHYDVTGKACPNVANWLEPDTAWKAWKGRLTQAPATLYRVRKAWADAKTQVGAFLSLENAKRCAAEHEGYHVFDNNGNEII